MNELHAMLDNDRRLFHPDATQFLDGLQWFSKHETQPDNFVGSCCVIMEACKAAGVPSNDVVDAGGTSDRSESVHKNHHCWVLLCA